MSIFDTKPWRCKNVTNMSFNLFILVFHIRTTRSLSKKKQKQMLGKFLFLYTINAIQRSRYYLEMKHCFICRILSIFTWLNPCKLDDGKFWAIKLMQIHLDLQIKQN